MKLPEPKYENTTVEIANIESPNIRYSRSNGCLLIGVEFDYDGAGQSCGIMIDADFIMAFMDVFGAEYLNDCYGPIIVEHSIDGIKRLLPINPKQGTEFDIVKWADKLNRKELEQKTILVTEPETTQIFATINHGHFMVGVPTIFVEEIIANDSVINKEIGEKIKAYYDKKAEEKK